MFDSKLSLAKLDNFLFYLCVTRLMTKRPKGIVQEKQILKYEFISFLHKTILCSAEV